MTKILRWECEILQNSETGADGTAVHSDLVPGALLGDVHLVGGKILVSAGEDILHLDPRIDCAGEIRQLVPVLPESLDFPYEITTTLLMRSVSGPGYDCSINGMSDWYIEGSDTAQIRITSPDRSCIIPVVIPSRLASHASPFPVPSKDHQALLVVYLAAHRADADLIVTTIDAETGRETLTTVAFDPTFFGGKDRSKFQKVVVRLPQTVGRALVSLQVAYQSGGHNTVEAPPFLFVSQPQITIGQENHSLIPITVPGALINDGIWLQADVPMRWFASNDLIRVCYGDYGAPVFKGAKTSVVCRNNFGHYIEFSASKLGHFSLWVNGKPEISLSLGPDFSGIRLPQAFLTGEVTFLQLFDPSGTEVFWSDWTVIPKRLTTNEILLRESQKPFPDDMFAQTRDRNRALRAHVTAGSPASVLGQLDHVLDTLEGGYDGVKLRPLTFKHVDKPLVSVIIPAHNKVNVTYSCLAALLLAHNKASFEIILVDDASTDETTQIETLVSGIVVVRNEDSQRFIRACNAGVGAARGTYVCLLNNDTEPTAGWLDELVAAFGRFDKVGLVGSKLLYPDGTLQDAGGIIWGSGNPWNYNLSKNPWEPRFSYARQVDYVSGAAMMTTRAIWDQVGGLSSYLEPMYFEDTDFAFKVREAGFTTWFVPSSIVYHYEGMTSGTDTTTGFKRFQEVNRPAFKKRWSKAFADNGKEGIAPDLAKDRNIVGRVLFIDSTTPTPDRDAGSYAAIQEIRLVQSLGYKVTFLPENLANMASRTSDLEKMGVEVITAPFYRSIEEFLRERGSEFDVVYITRYSVANSVIDKIRAHAPCARVILNNADLHFLRALRTAVLSKDPTAMAQVATVRREELAAMSKVNLVLSYNEVEHSVIQSHTDGAVKVMKCPWVVECPDLVAPRSKRSGVSFLGSFNHHPNVDGVEWFAKDIMPLFQSPTSSLTLSIYGSGMGKRIKDLKSDFVDPVGFVENAADAYDRHLVFLAPLLSGAGLKGKVLMALALGTPSVLSPVAAEGIGLRDGFDCFIAETPEDWQRAVTALIKDSALWTKMSNNGRDLARAQYGFERGRGQMRQAFEAIEMFGSH